jgi:tropomyosin
MTIHYYFQDSVLTYCELRLRQTDIKAGHYERKVQALEDQQAKLETRYEDAITEHNRIKKELDDLASQMADI